MRLTFVLVMIAMVLQGAFLALSLALPFLLHDNPGPAAQALRQDWWERSGFGLLMLGVLAVLPMLALQAPRAGRLVRAGTVAYALAVLAQGAMLVLLSQEGRLAAPSGLGAWAPGIGAFGAWLLSLTLIVQGRRQTNAALRAARSSMP